MGRKKKSDAEKLAALLGIEAPKSQLDPTEHPYEVSRQAEAVLAYAQDASYFVTKDCKTCGHTFAHTKGAVAYCSDPCRAVALEAIGIKWEWTRPPEKRWGTEPPLVVPAQAFALIPEPAPLEQPEQPEETAELDPSTLDILDELGLS